MISRAAAWSVAAHPGSSYASAATSAAAGAIGGDVAAVTSFLQSKEGKQLQKEVVRGVFGLLKKRL